MAKFGKNRNQGNRSYLRRYAAGVSHAPRTPNMALLEEYQQRTRSIGEPIVSLTQPPGQIEANQCIQRLKLFEELDSKVLVEAIWQGAFKQGVSRFNYIQLLNYGSNGWVRLYFSGERYVFIERRIKVVRASIVYTSRSRAYRAYEENKVCWVEALQHK